LAIALYYIAAMKVDDNLIEYLQASHEEAIEKGLALFADRMEEIVIVEKKKRNTFLTYPAKQPKVAML
jgi:hypothetical protein